MAAVMVEKRSLGALSRMGVVAGMHVAVVLLVANSLGLAPKLKVPEIIEGTVINEKPIDEPPPVVTYTGGLTQTDVSLPKPDDAATETDDQDAITAKLVDPGELKIERPEPVHQNLVAVRPDPAHPLTQPIYPAVMIRNSAEGVVELEVFVEPNGRVSDARILRSSGFDAFDRATLDEAKRRWRLLPATRDGVPYPQWARQRVVFKLVNR